MKPLGVARVILFAKDMEKMEAFYGGVLGLRRVEGPDDSAEFFSFDAGPVQISLHAVPAPWAEGIEILDPPEPRRGAAIKLAFHAEDVHSAREELVARGAPMGPVRELGSLQLCDGTDPEGNVFQISNRP